MQLENQVCSLELSKKIKELGVKRESLFYWTENYPNGYILGYWEELGNAEDRYITKQFSAFTVAELGEMLSQDYFPEKCGRRWIKLNREMPDVDESTEADARAKMLIYLLQNNLISKPQ